MSTLQVRLTLLAQAIGADIKSLANNVASKAALTDVSSYFNVTRRSYTMTGLVSGADNTAAINAAIANAAAYDTITIPPGDWTHSNIIQHQKADVTVLGYGARLIATNPATAAYHINADRSVVKGLTHQVLGVTSRGNGQNTSTCPFIVDNCADVVIEDLVSIGSLDTAFFVFAGVRVKGRNLTGQDSFADGFHITYGSRDCDFQNLDMKNPGDDGVAVVSYVNDVAVCQDIYIKNIRVTNGNARGVSVVGGTRIDYEDVHIRRTRGSSIYVAVESGQTNAMPVDTVNIINGDIVDGNWDPNLDTGQIAVSNLLSGSLLKNVLIQGFVVEGNRKFTTGECYCKVGTANGSGGRMIGVVLRDIWLRGGSSTGSPGWVFPDGVNTATVTDGSYTYMSGSGTGVTTTTDGYTVSGATNIADSSTTTAAPGLTVDRVRVGGYGTNGANGSNGSNASATVVEQNTAASLASKYATTAPIAGMEYEETDTRLYKIGDGSTTWPTLPYGPGGIKRTAYGSATTASTLTGTHQLSAGVKRVFVRGYSAGGGGGGGGVSASGTVATGGGGGAGGAYSETWIDAADLPSNLGLPYQVGYGGTGGAGRSNAGSGSAGLAGPLTFIGASTLSYGFGTSTAAGGSAGLGGATAAAATTTAYGVGVLSVSGAGAASVSTGSTGGNGGVPTNGSRAGSGGGAGGGVTTTPSAGSGGIGGTNFGVSGGSANGGNAAANMNGTTSPILGAGGGGGGNGSATANGIAVSGGTGGFPAGGGGGGGAAISTALSSGTGGRGGNGWLEIVEYF